MILALTATPSPRDLARAAFREGETAFRVGRFSEAHGAFERAYRAHPSPVLLFDMAQCQMELGAYREALFLYEGYLHEAPTTPRRRLVEVRMREAATKLETQRNWLLGWQRVAEAQAEQKRAQLEPVYRKSWFWGLVAGAAVTAVGTGAAFHFLSGGGQRSHALETR